MIIQNIQQKIILIFSKINQHKRNKNKRIIYISSMSAHKNNQSRYGKSKFEIEKFCIKEKILIIRPVIFFGEKKL